jgi:hypothetical protein
VIEQIEEKTYFGAMVARERPSALRKVLDMFGEFFDLLGLLHHGD